MKLFKELIKRLKEKTVYAPIVGFIVTVLVSSEVINLGSNDIASTIEMIIQVIGALLTMFGVANNPTDKENF